MIQRITSPDQHRLERLAVVHRTAFAPASRGWSGAEIASLSDHGILIADDADRGFALFSVAMDEAELLTVAVDPDHQREGIARGLLKAGEEALREQGIAKIHLEVAAQNHAAARLYRVLGFDVSGVRKGYYRLADGGRADALMMVKWLSREQG